MQYFTIQAKSDYEAVEKMKSQYGPGARILTRKNIKMGGWLGIFKKEGIEVTGYISNEKMKSQNRHVEEEKKKILESVKNEQAITTILREIRELKENINGNKPTATEEHESIVKIKEILALNDFSYSIIDEMVGRIKNEFSIEDINKFHLVQKSVLNWIGEKLQIYPDNKKAIPKIIVIVGPTGVGKTTTIAKLAAIYGLENNVHVRLVTIDNYKIAAKKQIETYADIMQIPVSFTESKEELEKLIRLYQDANVILIDTIGKSPYDYEKLSEMQSILSACGTKSEIHLAVSATTKGTDIEEIMHQFEPFKYKAVIITKVDETSKIGNVISAVVNQNKKISYITDGQMVPQDIDDASVSKMLMNLEGFMIDREYIEKKFS
jgi:flagellar biosynthesis protein FlhF